MLGGGGGGGETEQEQAQPTGAKLTTQPGTACCWGEGNGYPAQWELSKSSSETGLVKIITRSVWAHARKGAKAPQLTRSTVYTSPQCPGH